MATQEEILNAIKALPHLRHIQSKDLSQWLKLAEEVQGTNRLFWNIKRASAVGGSEVGVLLLESMGLTPAFERTGQLLASEKLFKIMPTYPLPHMTRGIFLEKPMIEAIFNIYGGERDVAAEESFNHPNENAPASMAGNPDLYWSNRGRRILVDTKVPINATDKPSDELGEAKNAKLLGYKAQVHHYDILGTAAGYPADQLVIAELDVPVALADVWVQMIKSNQHQQVVRQMTELLVNEQPGMRINFIEVEKDLHVNQYGHDVPIKDAITSVCDTFMEGLVTGDIHHVEVEKGDLPDDQLHKLEQLDQRSAVIRTLRDYLDKQLGEVNSQMTRMVGDSSVNGKELSLPYYSVSRKNVFDTKRAVKTLDNYQIDTSSFMNDDPTNLSASQLNIGALTQFLHEQGMLEKFVISPSYDEEKVKEALLQIGEAIESFEIDKVSLRKRSSKEAKALYSDLFEDVKSIDDFIALKEVEKARENLSVNDSSVKGKQEVSVNI